MLSFVHLFPQQANGYPGIDFGNQCWAETYPGPGYGGQNRPANNRLLKCPNLQQDLYSCRQREAKTGKKVFLLSLGGGTAAYQLTGAVDGDTLAKQLWFMFGPRQSGWVGQGRKLFLILLFYSFPFLQLGSSSPSTQVFTYLHQGACISCSIE